MCLHQHLNKLTNKHKVLEDLFRKAEDCEQILAVDFEHKKTHVHGGTFAPLKYCMNIWHNRQPDHIMFIYIIQIKSFKHCTYSDWKDHNPCQMICRLDGCCTGQFCKPE